MSDNKHANSSKTKVGKRKPKDLESELKQKKGGKRVKSTSSDDSEPVKENSLVSYKKFENIVISDSDIDEKDDENKEQIVPFATNYSSNPLSTFSTFVCHLGNWTDPLKAYLKHPQFKHIFDFVRNEYDSKTCFPPKQLIFNAFQRTPFDKLKVVMLGNDPYPTANQANGLSFSVSKAAKCTPMLQNIYKALAKDSKTGFRPPTPLHGDLSNWANQGVLMLNNNLSVREGTSYSHSKSGWNKFTQEVIKAINKEKEGVVFLCWGGQAKKICKSIDRKKHHVLTYGNPAPLSQQFQKFEDCRNFSKVNELLREEGLSEIDWNLD